jgi:hypothetical protein
VNFKVDEPVSGLTVEFQHPISRVDGNATLLADRHRIVLPALKAGDDLSIRIHYSR